jgi:penicillin-binding protein 1A
VPPEGLVEEGGNWVYEEYARGGGVASLGLEELLPKPPSEQERSGILDLFRR